VRGESDDGLMSSCDFFFLTYSGDRFHAVQLRQRCKNEFGNATCREGRRGPTFIEGECSLG
jgi:hypothetical protein